MDEPNTAIRRQGRVAGVILVISLVATACSSAASAAPSATPAPTPSTVPTVAPTPIATVASSPTPAVAIDAAAGLAIASPYTLALVDSTTQATFSQQMTASLGAFGSAITVGIREAMKAGAVAAYVVVIGFPAGLLTDASFAGVEGGLAGSSKVTLATTTVSGVAVGTGSNATAGYGVFRVGDRVIMVITPPATPADPVAAALIAANK